MVVDELFLDMWFWEKVFQVGNFIEKEFVKYLKDFMDMSDNIVCFDEEGNMIDVFEVEFKEILIKFGFLEF